MAPVLINGGSSSESLSSITNAKMIPVGEYLFLRLGQVNPKMKTIFGIPGDFNLALLEHFYCDSVVERDINFVGLCNELNAAYTADGYARLMGFSALITTYGVGELSAINGVAGAFSEYVPLLQIVGTSSQFQKAYSAQAEAEDLVRKNHHHLIQNKNALKSPNHYVYENMVNDISVVNESLDNLETACEQIDNAIRTTVIKSRPGYLFIPSNFSDLLVPASKLAIPLFPKVEVDKKLSQELAEKIVEKLYKASNPAILGDVLVRNFKAEAIFTELINKVDIKLFTTNISKGMIDETHKNFVGTYYAALSATKELRKEMESCDVVFHVGSYNVETNTGGYSGKMKDVIELHPDFLRIDGKIYQDFDFVDILTTIVEIIEPSRIARPNFTYKYTPKQFCQSSEATLDQNYLTDKFNQILRPNDIVVVETCTFLFAVPDLKFPENVKFIAQGFYGSIGYCLPATLGISIANKDLGRGSRIISVQGDGSCQMTIQEYASYLRYNINPIIMLLNNDGYTVERIIRGPTRHYNDIAPNWDWCGLFKVLGDSEGKKHESRRINNKEEFEAVFANDQITGSDKIQMLELILRKLDAPGRFAYVSGCKPISELD